MKPLPKLMVGELYMFVLFTPCTVLYVCLVFYLSIVRRFFTYRVQLCKLTTADDGANFYTICDVNRICVGNGLTCSSLTKRRLVGGCAAPMTCGIALVRKARFVSPVLSRANRYRSGHCVPVMAY